MRGFITDGAQGKVIIFDLKTLKVKATLNVGEKPDAILYDAFSKQVFVFNAKSHDCSIIDAAKNTVTATVALLGLLPAALAQGLGSDIQRPLATVVVGGLLTATALTLLLLPVLYVLVERRAKAGAGADDLDPALGAEE